MRRPGNVRENSFTRLRLTRGQGSGWLWHLTDQAPHSEAPSEDGHMREAGLQEPGVSSCASTALEPP